MWIRVSVIASSYYTAIVRNIEPGSNTLEPEGQLQPDPEMNLAILAFLHFFPSSRNKFAVLWHQFQREARVSFAMVS